MRNGPVRM